MGLLDFFRTKQKHMKVLVCCIGSQHESELQQDAIVYREFYPDTTITRMQSASELLAALDERYFIVHVLASVDVTGGIAASGITGTQVIQRAQQNGTGLLWFAADNQPDGYIKDFHTGGGINLVMTIARLGADMPAFIRNLFTHMRSGETMPVAWNSIAPQIPNMVHEHIPEQIFAAGAGSAKFF